MAKLFEIPLACNGTAWWAQGQSAGYVFTDRDLRRHVSLPDGLCHIWVVVYNRPTPNRFAVVVSCKWYPAIVSVPEAEPCYTDVPGYEIDFGGAWDKQFAKYIGRTVYAEVQYEE